MLNVELERYQNELERYQNVSKSQQRPSKRVRAKSQQSPERSPDEKNAVKARVRIILQENLRANFFLI